MPIARTKPLPHGRGSVRFSAFSHAVLGIGRLDHSEGVLGRDSYLVPTLNRIPILRSMVPSGPREGIPVNVGARRDSRTSGPGVPRARPPTLRSARCGQPTRGGVVVVEGLKERGDQGRRKADGGALKA